MARLIGPINSGKAVGNNGVATANADSSTLIIGELLGLYIKYNDSPPATTDVTIKTKGTSPQAPSFNILVLTDANTDGWKRPMQQACDAAGSAIAGAYMPVLLTDFINIAIAQANANDTVDVWLVVE